MATLSDAGALAALMGIANAMQVPTTTSGITLQLVSASLALVTGGGVSPTRFPVPAFAPNGARSIGLITTPVDLLITTGANVPATWALMGRDGLQWVSGVVGASGSGAELEIAPAPAVRAFGTLGIRVHSLDLVVP